MNHDDTVPANRMAEPRKRGPKPGPPAPEVPAAILGAVSVPPLICPTCGRGMQPRIVRTRQDGRIDCLCALGGCRFVWTPPRVRAIT